LKARRRKRRIILAASAFLLLLSICAGVIGLSWLPAIRIRSIEVAGASSVSEKSVQDAAQAELAGTYGYVLPRDNIFLYPQGSIQKKLLRDFSAFETAEVHRTSLDSLKITVVERKTAALWCGASEDAPSPCYLLDQDGVAYAPAADFSGEVYMRYYGPVSTSTPMQFATPDRFRAVSSLVAAIREDAKGEVPASVMIDAQDAQVAFESGFRLIYALKDDGADVLERFALAIKADPFTKHALSDFQYLDLRFGDKLYYKLK
jgi:cell division septal protein FtsQ